MAGAKAGCNEFASPNILAGSPAAAISVPYSRLGPGAGVAKIEPSIKPLTLSVPNPR
jgi:hypothetical protein